MISLERWKGRQIDKWSHYLPIYEKHFERFIDKAPRILELGVDHGGSLQLWKEYFGPRTEIIGIDINPACKEYEESQITIHTMDERDPAIAELGPFDIVIDDGSHILGNQTIAFRNLWPRTLGVYLIEDCHGMFPVLPHEGSIRYEYPWVVVMERPKRIIRGTPSRELRPDEALARANYGP